MTTKDLVIPQQLAVTFTKIWQRCTHPSYMDYLNRQRFFYKIANQAMALLLSIVTILTLAVVSILAWQEVLRMGTK